MLLLGETATLGAFLAQDLLLFVLFFDLMLVPFYFLFGGWGEDRPDGTSAVAGDDEDDRLHAGRLAADAGRRDRHGDPRRRRRRAHLLDRRRCAQNLLAEGSQDWIFWFFAAAFLVKMPAFLVHGWMPDAYRAAPLPALAVFSRGALEGRRLRLPAGRRCRSSPTRRSQFQEVVLVIALASILYGSVMAFTQTNVRLIAGYSSVAQLGFITLGIFALRPDGADGARAADGQPRAGRRAAAPDHRGARRARRHRGPARDGRLAMRAPVLAALFLIVTLATLAMPGSANFIGEFFILNGVFQAKIVFAVVASDRASRWPPSTRCASTSARCTTASRRRSSRARSACARASCSAPLVACIVALALYPQLILTSDEAGRRPTRRRRVPPVVERRDDDLQRPRHRLRRRSRRSSR